MFVPKFAYWANTYYKAQGKNDKANAYFTLSLFLTSTIAVICWIGLTVFDDQLLRLFGADDILLPLAKAYLRPIQFVIPAYPFTQMLAAYLRNDNAPGFAAFATLCGGCFNIFGDLYFVFGLNMGIFGAGLATAIGVTLTIAVMVSHFFSRKMRSGYPGFMVIFIRQKSWCSTAVPSLFQKSRWE